MDDRNTGSGGAPDVEPTDADDAGSSGTFETVERGRAQVLQFAVSTAAIFGSVVVFEAGIAGVAPLAAWVVDSLLGGAGSGDLRTRLGLAGSLLVSPATFLFVALYDDATLSLPAWPERHPPLADAWLLVLAGYGVVALAPSTPEWPWLLQAGGLLAGPVASYLVVPVWLGRRSNGRAGRWDCWRG
jgi:hypothetical protein